MAEEDTMAKDMMSMMMVIMMIAVLSQMIPGQVQAAPPENGVPAGRTVTIALKNPPTDATMWVLVLTDWDVTVPIDFVGGNGRNTLDIAETATFEIPAGLNFPLRIAYLLISETTLIGLYEVQSAFPDRPNYKEAFLNAFGHSYYDVSLEAFTLW